jgi:hypothetical protein
MPDVSSNLMDPNLLKVFDPESLFVAGITLEQQAQLADILATVHENILPRPGETV